MDCYVIAFFFATAMLLMGIGLERMRRSGPAHGDHRSWSESPAGPMSVAMMAGGAYILLMTLLGEFCP